jgi:hypothetical protein
MLTYTMLSFALFIFPLRTASTPIPSGCLCV